MAERAVVTTNEMGDFVNVVFGRRSELMRYVVEEQRLKSSKPAPDTFRRNPDEDHLSVNLVDLESREEIVSYYRERFQEGQGEVAVCHHKILEYNSACSRTAVVLSYNRTRSQWEFRDKSNNLIPAYRSRPVPTGRTRSSKSHSGVEYVRMFGELDENRFARRMSNKRFHRH